MRALCWYQVPYDYRWWAASSAATPRDEGSSAEELTKTFASQLAAAVCSLLPSSPQAASCASGIAP